jgi:uncharacterized repeat protein (TIGR02543 family)
MSGDGANTVMPTSGAVSGEEPISNQADNAIGAVTATFKANGGGTVKPASIKGKAGVALGTLPTVARNGFVFTGWFSAKTGGKKITKSTTMPVKNTTYYAHWTARNYTITFKGNGGKIGLKSSVKKTGKYASKIKPPQKVKRAGYQFTGWYTKKSGGKKITAKTGISRKATYYAHWRKKVIR